MVYVSQKYTRSCSITVLNKKPISDRIKVSLIWKDTFLGALSYYTFKVGIWQYTIERTQWIQSSNVIAVKAGKHAKRTKEEFQRYLQQLLTDFRVLFKAWKVCVFHVFRSENASEFNSADVQRTYRVYRIKRQFSGLSNSKTKRARFAARLVLLMYE